MSVLSRKKQGFFCSVLSNGKKDCSNYDSFQLHLGTYPSGREFLSLQFYVNRKTFLFVISGKIHIKYVCWSSVNDLETKTDFLLLQFTSYSMLLDTSLKSVFDALSNDVFAVGNLSSQSFRTTIKKFAYPKNMDLSGFSSSRSIYKFNSQSKSAHRDEETLLFRMVYHRSIFISLEKRCIQMFLSFLSERWSSMLCQVLRVIFPASLKCHI